MLTLVVNVAFRMLCMCQFCGSRRYDHTLDCFANVYTKLLCMCSTMVDDTDHSNMCGMSPHFHLTVQSSVKVYRPGH